MSAFEGFTARGNNFDVLNFTDMTTEELASKINEAIDGLDFDAEHVTSLGDTQSELVEKATMKTTSLGYDPMLGKKFSDESSGLVIGRAASSPEKLEKQAIEDYSREHGRAPDVQQLHDWMRTSSNLTPVTRASITDRMAQMTPQQRAKLFDDLL